jgi:hypothetical protein
MLGVVGELLPAEGCGREIVTVSLDDRDRYFASPCVSERSGNPWCHRSHGRAAGPKNWGSGSVATLSRASSGGPDISLRSGHLAPLYPAWRESNSLRHHGRPADFGGR